MNARALASFGLCLGLLSRVCYSQETTINFKALQPESWSSPRITLTEPSATSTFGDSSSAEILGALGDDRWSEIGGAAPAGSGSAVSLRKVAPPVKVRVADGRYFLVNTMELLAAMADVANTQHCIAMHTCHEANPLMPSSAVGQTTINIGESAVSFAYSYYAKKRHVRTWWMEPALGIGIHGYGFYTGTKAW